MKIIRDKLATNQEGVPVKALFVCDRHNDDGRRLRVSWSSCLHDDGHRISRNQSIYKFSPSDLGFAALVTLQLVEHRESLEELNLSGYKSAMITLLLHCCCQQTNNNSGDSNRLATFFQWVALEITVITRRWYYISEQTGRRYVISSKQTLQRLRDVSLDSITAGDHCWPKIIVMAVEQLFGGRGVVAADFVGVTFCLWGEKWT